MRRLIWGVVIGVLLAPAGVRAQSEEVVYYHTDAIGSVRLITSETGAVLAEYDYFPFGQPWPPSQSRDVRQFTGKERDPDTGLDYFGARYYSSHTGRFTSVDPGHENGNIFDPQSWNGYAYARNNPLRFTDPTGTTYEICVYTDADRTSQSCGMVSDQYFGILQRNPGKGFRLSGNEILMGESVVGSYKQIRRDPTLGGFISSTGQLADRWLKEQTTEMVKGAALTAVTAGVGFGVQAGLEAIMAARAPTVVFKIGAANMTALSSAGIDASTAQQAARLLIQSRLRTIPSVGTKIEGFVEINGRLLKVTAGVNAAGQVSVGAIRVIR